MRWAEGQARNYRQTKKIFFCAFKAQHFTLFQLISLITSTHDVNCNVVTQINQIVITTGAHTIGDARCTSFRSHIYNDTNIDTSFAQSTQSNCPVTSGSGDDNLAPLDLQTPYTFDNYYYKNLINQKGLLHSDQELYNNGSTDSQVQTYSTNPSQFSTDFAAAMIKMGDISPLTGSQGEIRKNCRVVN